MYRIRKNVDKLTSSSAIRSNDNYFAFLTNQNRIKHRQLTQMKNKSEGSPDFRLNLDPKYTVY